MVSVDTPESSTTPACHPPPRPPSTAAADACKTAYNALPKKLRDYLIGRLAPDAAERHIAAGHGASATFEALQELRLTRPNGLKSSPGLIAPICLPHAGRHKPQ